MWKELRDDLITVLWMISETNQQAWKRGYPTLKKRENKTTKQNWGLTVTHMTWDLQQQHAEYWRPSCWLLPVPPNRWRLTDFSVTRPEATRKLTHDAGKLNRT
jgi:hypothetical protein